MYFTSLDIDYNLYMMVRVDMKMAYLNMAEYVQQKNTCQFQNKGLKKAIDIDNIID